MSKRYFEAMEYLNALPRFSGQGRFLRTKTLMKKLPPLSKDMKIIHVAGTNGKGSVCSYLESVYREEGYSTGLFTSPHLVKINERFMINGEIVDDEAFADAFDRVKSLISDAENVGISYFDFLFLVAICVFGDKKPDILILETGLGGRLDATNVIDNPTGCVITSISLDHTGMLGNTIEEIAAEKAGIIKKGVPCFTLTGSKAADEVINSVASNEEAIYYPVDTSEMRLISANADKICFEYEGRKYEISTGALYQVENATLAVKVVKGLRDVLPVSDESICKGLVKARWAGRMEKIQDGVYIDGAHNADGIRRFAESALSIANVRKIHILFAAASDKDITEMVDIIATALKPETVIVTELATDRKVSAEGTAKCFKKSGCRKVMAIADIGEAYDTLLQVKGEAIACCVGSLYLVGAIMTKNSLDENGFL